MDINQYYDQHSRLLELAVKLKDDLEIGDSIRMAEVAFGTLCELSANLVIHLAMEDSVLYPHLLDSGDTQVRETAKSFQEEMGGIVQVFLNYTGQWSDINAIRLEPEEFRKQTTTIYQALGDRVSKENQTLYPLAR